MIPSEVMDAFMEASQLSTFESSTDEAYRKGLRDALAVVIQHCRIMPAELQKPVEDVIDSEDESSVESNANDTGTSHVLRYDPHLLQEALLRIDWKAMGKQYDHTVERRQPQTKKDGQDDDDNNNNNNNNNLTQVTPVPRSTAFVEVMNQLCDPTLIPLACYSAVAFVLLQALFVSGSGGYKKNRHNLVNWTPSQRRIVQYIDMLALRRCPWLHTTRVLHTWLQSFLTDGTATAPKPPAVVFHRVLSFLTEASQRMLQQRQLQQSVCLELDDTALLNSAMFLLHSVDGQDLRYLGAAAAAPTPSSNSSIAARSTSSNVNASNEGPPRKRRAIATLEDLHERMNEARPTPVVASVPSAVRVSVKDVLTAPSTLNNTASSTHAVAAMPMEMMSVRVRAFKKVLGLFDELSAQCCRLQWRLLDCALEAVCNTGSASYRLCLMSLVDSLNSNRAFHRIMRQLWGKWKDHGDDTDFLLRVYSEFLVEASFFDQRSECWKALQPIFDLVLKPAPGTASTTDVTTEAASCASKSVIPTKQQQALYALAYILTRRCRIFQAQNDKIHKTFRAHVTKLSLVYGGLEYWIAPNADPQQRERIAQTLQILGIVGFWTHDEEGSTVSAATTAPSLPQDPPAHDLVAVAAGQQAPMDLCPQTYWPFRKPFDIRSAHQRMGQQLQVMQRRDLLSSRTHDLRTPIVKIFQPVSILRERNDGSRVMDNLNDDLVHNIFSYLGYKRLVTVMHVCKSWNKIAHSPVLWRAAYKHRFGLCEDDPYASCSTAVFWKEVFVEKWLAERQIRFQRHRSGWKVRTCGYVHCLQVLRTPSQWNKHKEIHKRRLAREAERKQRAEVDKKRKRKRNSNSDSSASSGVPSVVIVRTKAPIKPVPGT